MAEILVQNLGHTGDPVLPKRGDIRGFGPNDHTWGLREDKRKWVAAGRLPEDFPPDYGVIQVATLSVPNLRKMLRSWVRAAVQGDPEFDYVDEADRFVREHKFAWKVNINDLTPTQKSNFNQDGFAVIPKAKFVEVAEHKALGISFDENDPDGFGAPRLPGSGSD